MAVRWRQVRAECCSVRWSAPRRWGCRRVRKRSTSSTYSIRERGSPFGGTDITTTLTNQRLPVLKDLMRDLRTFGLSPNTLNQEWGPTQYELNFDPADGTRAGDLCFTYKTYAKDIASHNGYLVSFMTKPFAEKSGCSSHLHMSLFQDGRNIFYDPDDDRGVSNRFRWAVGGQLEHARALNAIFGPTVNCPKRYKKGTYAPASISWGFENRSVAVRVKAWRKEKTHIENRLGCGSSNPYLALAAMLAASLDGIENEVEPPDPLQTNAYSLEDLDLLPLSVEESLDHFEKDESLKGPFRSGVHQGVRGPQTARDRKRAPPARITEPMSGTRT